MLDKLMSFYDVHQYCRQHHIFNFRGGFYQNEEIGKRGIRRAVYEALILTVNDCRDERKDDIFVDFNKRYRSKKITASYAQNNRGKNRFLHVSIPDPFNNKQTVVLRFKF